MESPAESSRSIFTDIRIEACTNPGCEVPIPGVDPRLAPILYSFQQAREDLAEHTDGLSADQIWATPFGFGSAGFSPPPYRGQHQRLITYLEGKQLSDAQIEAVKREKDPGATREELLAVIDAAFSRAETIVRAINPASLADTCEVGRMRLPTTVAGLLTHIAEHTQRHVGQASARQNSRRFT